MTRSRLGKRFFLILQDINMLKLVIVINFRNKENPEIFSFVFWDDKFSFICGETLVYYMIYHEEYFLLSNQRRLG